MVKKNIAIIGAGQLGSRHLQALAQLEEDVSFYIVDPSNLSLGVSIERFNEVNHDKKSLKALNNVSELPRVLEFVIISTNSKQRLDVLRELLNHAEVKYLLLEKFLFPHIWEYEEAKKLLNNTKTKVYVNCVKRMWPNYQELKSLLKLEKNIHFELSGGQWNLASNAIHFLDFFLYMTNESFVHVDTSLLDNELSNNKRDGYVEFMGTLKMITPNLNTLVLTSKSNNTEPYQIRISSNNYKIEIFEVQEKCIVNGKEMEFKMYYQSNLTNIVYLQLCHRGDCDLVDFKTAADEHMMLLRAFNSYLDGREGIIT
ncbi:Gfo/Idh/MocA family oxidoreductase [Lysinibacillus capsici]|uniref:Gfo/Idh/MocA family oxidoreductase n=1 Tax=Lysinibacillus capsici TaxID=2115968 RepID=UPI0034E5665F